MRVCEKKNTDVKCILNSCCMYIKPADRGDSVQLALTGALGSLMLNRRDVGRLIYSTGGGWLYVCTNSGFVCTDIGSICANIG